MNYRRYIIVVSLLLAGCAGTVPDEHPTAEMHARYKLIKQRLDLRRDSTQTASYRIRWRVREVAPHGEMILRIDYQAPNRYRIYAKGPLDIPLFTAWVVDSQFTVLAHRDEQLQRGHLRELNFGEFMMDAQSFSGFLALFAGGSGVSLPDSLAETNPGFTNITSKNLSWQSEQGQICKMDLKRSRLKRIEWKKEKAWELWVRFSGFKKEYPFWELHSANWENHDGPGKYYWEVIDQLYNHPLPDRIFNPPAE